MTDGTWTAEYRPTGETETYNYEIRSSETCNGKPMLIAQVCLFPDANLIAAAPDLLEACKSAKAYIEAQGVTGTYGAYHDTLEQLESAIARAEGKEAQS